MSEQVLRAPAKVNLFLEILGRRADGFHDLESVFQELDLADELSVAANESGGIRLRCDDAGVPTDSRNLAVRAAEALRKAARVDAGADLVLRKRIPAGGGLGGGSSDAAAALIGLDKAWGLDWPRERLAAVAAEIGSDVPFFLYGGTCRCRGRGEEVTPAPNACALRFVLVMPEWPVGTADAYAALRPEDFGRRRADALLDALRDGNEAAAIAALHNGFEEPVFRLEPRERALYEALGALGFAAVRMSGSGSTLFGVVPPENGEEASAALAAQAEALAGVRRAVSARCAGLAH